MNVTGNARRLPARVKKNKFTIMLLLMGMIILWPTVCLAQTEIEFSCQMPYSLGKITERVVAGQRVNMLFTIDHCGLQDETVPVKITFPQGLIPAGKYEGWTLGQVGETYSLERQLQLAGGYSQWFDLLTVQTDGHMPSGNYVGQIQVGTETKHISLPISAGEKRVEQPITVDNILLPLDKDGKKDDRQTASTLVLRDRSLDYYKNIINGKGTSNLEVEAIHPITHMIVEIANPREEQKLVVLTTCLLDSNTHEPIPGLFTPGTTGEDKDAGALEGHDHSLVAFVALSGEKRQRILLPVYADEKVVAGGKYMLQVSMEDEFSNPIVKEVPLTIVKKDWKAIGVVSVAMTVLGMALVLVAGRSRSLLSTMKTRWLVTIALFGAVAFAVVNVPSTLLGDFFHILLGPFGFLITGLFSSVCLYMLIISLVILIPRPGVVTLMAFVRMMLGMLAFGHISPVSILSYGMNALMLEGLLYYSGMFQTIESSNGEISQHNILLLALICGGADSIATYVSMEAMSFLYRFYYADWYIYMLIVVNSCIYTAIGAKCGAFLGCKLSRVGGD